MNKYVGTYRVRPELYFDDVKEEICVSPETYIDCYRDVEIYRYDRNLLAMQCPNVAFFNARVQKLEKEKYWHSVLDTDDGGIIYFREVDFDKIQGMKIGKGEFIKPKTSGKNIDPKSKKNILKKYKSDPQLFLDEMGVY